MPNIEDPGLTADERIACAILCCDKAKYKMPKGSGERWKKRCQRLANRKHSCVLHQLREKKGGKLTQEPRFKKPPPPIEASPRFDFTSDPEVGRVLIPDIVVGERVIDAKFKCKSKELGDKMKGQKVQYPSPPGMGGGGTPKEELEYMKIFGEEAEPVTPEAAAANAPAGGCACENLQKTSNMA